MQDENLLSEYLKEKSEGEEHLDSEGEPKKAIGFAISPNFFNQPQTDRIC
jgi:hypothetical protein